MSTARIGGVDVAYDDTGSGEPFVLVHGHPFDRSMWRPQVEHLGLAGWRVVAPDLRGYGKTPAVPGTTAWEDFARDVVGLLDHLEIERFFLGGLSMGGQIVMEVHRLVAHRIRGLLLADTSPEAESGQGRRARHATADRLLREGMGAYADEVLPLMVGPHTRLTRPAVTQHVLRMMRGTSPAGAAAALRARAERPDYLQMLERVAVPTLVVVGRDDEYTPVSTAQLMAERLPHSTLAIVEGTGHLPNLERPTEFNAILDAFLGAVAAHA